VDGTCRGTHARSITGTADEQLFGREEVLRRLLDGLDDIGAGGFGIGLHQLLRPVLSQVAELPAPGPR
jgi:hypothetical protein